VKSVQIYPILLGYVKSEQRSGKAVIKLEDMISFIKQNHPEFKLNNTPAEAGGFNIGE